MRVSRSWAVVVGVAVLSTVVAACSSAGGSSGSPSASGSSASGSSGSPPSSSSTASGPSSAAGSSAAGSSAAGSSAAGSASGGSAPASSTASVGFTGQASISFMEAMSSGTLKTAMQTLTSRFEKAYPNIKVTLIAEPNYGTLQAKEQAAIAAGNPPTMGQVYEGWAATYSQADAIAALAAFVNGPNGVSKADQAQIWPGVLKDQYLPDGKLWMWPFNKSDYVMFYNQDMLKAAGQQVPTTWAQYADVAKAVTKNGHWMVSMDPGTAAAPANGSEWYVAIMQSYGGQLVKNGKPDFDSPAAQQALTYLVNLAKSGALKLGTNYPGQTALGAGKTLADMSSIAGYYYEQQAVGKKFTLDVAAFPKGPTAQGNVMAGTNMVIFSKATTAQQQAAWQFMKWLTEPAQQAYWAETSGYLPVTKSALPLMKSYIASHPYQKIAADELAWSVGTPPYSWFAKAQGYLDNALEAAIGGHESVSAALSAAQSQAVQAANAS